MKINSVYSVMGQYNRQRTEAVYSQPRVQSSSDKVELSARAQLFTEALAAVKQGMYQEAAGYAAKVSDVAGRIRQGIYSVESGDICDKLLA